MHLHQSSFEDSASDQVFTQSLTEMPKNTNLQYPPVALIGGVVDLGHKRAKVRRLHLIVVDLWRPWQIRKAHVLQISRIMRRLQHNHTTARTTPIPLRAHPKPKHCRRSVFGYALDGSEFPVYLLWPQRTAQGHFWL